MEWEQSLLSPQQRVLSTMEKDGSRRWMYPRLALGRFLTRRRVVAYLLLAVFAMTPFLRIGGRPVLLLDVINRRFTILGRTFLPTDTAFLALFLLATLLTIFFVTALLGRVWCGWACPQTVYMEFVFRPIERLFTGRSGRGGKPADVAGWRKALMYGAFFIICLHLANTFLAYFVPPQTLHGWITSTPARHPAGFTIVAVVTALMMFDFCFFREQTCIIACPYGRLQSVLLDKWSLVISYDGRRGEPRGKKAKDEGRRMKDEGGIALPLLERSAAAGDCVDCDLCAAVCPTGIDIRDGLQVECIACAQCIDACDGVMDKIGRPRGLIRYSSQSAIGGEPRKVLRPRVIIYPAIVAAIVGVMGYLLATRSPADVTVLRNVGRPFVVEDGGIVENTMRVKITNRSDRSQRYVLSVTGPAGVRIETAQPEVVLLQGQSATEPVRLLAPTELFRPGMGKLDVKIRVTGEDNLQIDRECRLLGPVNLN